MNKNTVNIHDFLDMISNLYQLFDVDDDVHNITVVSKVHDVVDNYGIYIVRFETYSRFINRYERYNIIMRVQEYLDTLGVSFDYESWCISFAIFIRKV